MAAMGSWTLREWILLLVIFAAAPLFFIGGPDWLSPPLYRALWNLGHIIFFALLFFGLQWRWPVKSWLVAGLYLLLVFVGGGAIEFLQAKIGRDASWFDVAHNLLGSALGLVWGMAASRRVWLARLVFSVVLLWPLSGVARIAWVQVESANTFPLLASFETERELLRWEGQVQRVNLHANHGDSALEVSIGRERYSGISFNWFLGDWRGYEILAFDVFNPDDDTLPLMIRIHDLQHDQGNMAYGDRFNQSLLIAPGWNHLRIALADIRGAPEEREMDLQQLRSLGLFAIESPRERKFFLDHLRLESSP